jgi:F-type H+-transporting ATPase subunit gamma
MPALIDIRRRIRSVKNTQQITKAMKMVSAAKLRRAQEAMFAARPFARKMLEVLNSLATRAHPDAHPLLRERPVQRVLLVVVTADKGLAGGFNANIIRAALRFLHSDDLAGKDVQLEMVGRKGRDFFRRRAWTIRAEEIGLFQSLQFPRAQVLAQRLIKSYVDEQVDQIWVAFNEFKTVVQQRIVVERVLPIQRLDLEPTEPAQDYIYEPDARAIFDDILPKHVEMQVWRALLESAAAEHGARMAAMDAASNNAGEMIDRLTLYMNKVRQAAITKEIIEVVSGAGS